MTPAEFAVELAAWPPPIDVIRYELGLPERWQLRASRQLNRSLAIAGAITGLGPSLHTSAAFEGISYLYQNMTKGLLGEPLNKSPLYPWAPRPMRFR